MVHWAKHWRHYLPGSDFTVVTDHKPLHQILLDSRSAPITCEATRVARLALKMEEFRPRMKVEWRKGKENVLADAMTREPVAQREEPGITVAASPTKKGKERLAPRTEASETNSETNKDEKEDEEAATSNAEEADRTQPSAREKNAEEIRRLQREDPELRDIITYLEKHTLPAEPMQARLVAAQANHMHLEKGLLYNVWWPSGEAVSSRTRN